MSLGLPAPAQIFHAAGYVAGYVAEGSFFSR
jgi:hypothetical protein